MAGRPGEELIGGVGLRTYRGVGIGVLRRQPLHQPSLNLRDRVHDRPRRENRRLRPADSISGWVASRRGSAASMNIGPPGGHGTGPE